MYLVILGMVIPTKRVTEYVHCDGEGYPRCPPHQTFVKVVAIWDNQVATAIWTGKEWRLDVPGNRNTLTTSPKDWFYYEDSPFSYTGN